MPSSFLFELNETCVCSLVKKRSDCHRNWLHFNRSNKLIYTNTIKSNSIQTFKIPSLRAGLSLVGQEEAPPSKCLAYYTKLRKLEAHICLPSLFLTKKLLVQAHVGQEEAPPCKYVTYNANLRRLKAHICLPSLNLTKSILAFLASSFHCKNLLSCFIQLSSSPCVVRVCLGRP